LFQRFKSSFNFLSLLAKTKQGVLTTEALLGIPPLFHNVSKTFCFQPHVLKFK